MLTDDALAQIYDHPSSRPAPEPSRAPDAAELAAQKRYTHPSSRAADTRTDTAPAPTAQDPAQGPKGAKTQSPTTGPTDAADGRVAREAAPEMVKTHYGFSVPKGTQVDDATAEAFAGIARDFELAPEVQQRLVDLQTQQLRAQEAATAKAHAAWRAESTKLGRETLSDARDGLSMIETPHLRKLLAETKLGDHPTIIRTFAEIARLVRDVTRAR